MKIGIIGAGSIAAIIPNTCCKLKEAEAYAVASRSLEKAEEKDNRNSAVQRPDEQRGSYPDRRSRQLFGHSARRLAARAGCRRPVKIKKFPEKS